MSCIVANPEDLAGHSFTKFPCQMHTASCIANDEFACVQEYSTSGNYACTDAIQLTPSNVSIGNLSKRIRDVESTARLVERLERSADSSSHALATGHGASVLSLNMPTQGHPIPQAGSATSVASPLDSAACSFDKLSAFVSPARASMSLRPVPGSAGSFHISGDLSSSVPNDYTAVRVPRSILAAPGVQVYLDADASTEQGANNEQLVVSQLGQGSHSGRQSSRSQVSFRFRKFWALGVFVAIVIVDGGILIIGWHQIHAHGHAIPLEFKFAILTLISAGLILDQTLEFARAKGHLRTELRSFIVFTIGSVLGLTIAGWFVWARGHRLHDDMQIRQADAIFIAIEIFFMFVLGGRWVCAKVQELLE